MKQETVKPETITSNLVLPAYHYNVENIVVSDSKT